MKFSLLYDAGGGREEFQIDSPVVSIGRGPENQLVLTDFGISRKHCTLRWNGGELTIEDAGSRNGTKVNGKAVQSTKLRDGDELVLGRFALLVRSKDKHTTQGSFVIDEKPLVEAPGTIIKSMSELDQRLSAFIAADEIAPVKAKEAEKTEGGRAGKILLTLTQVARTLISADSLDEILNKVMDLTFEHLPAERGFLMLWDEEQQILVPRVIKQRDGSGTAAVSISKTISERVYHEQVSILTSDASIDPRFSGAESIIFHGIRSAMCVPLWNEGDVVGVVGVDSLLAHNRFDTDDLDLFTALANYSAVAIQRARLHQRVIEEMEAKAKLSRYHSPSVVSKILASGSVDDDWNIGVQERVVSVLFSDIVGFTSLSERLTPSEVAHALNHYFTEMAAVVFEYEGTLDKFIGDALMAVFGAPIQQDDHAERAVLAGLKMREIIKNINLKESLGLDLNFAIRIGINSGTVVAGDIGSPQRMDYTVIGDTVNTASRIEGDVCSPGEVVIGEPTWNLIKDQFVFEEIGSIPIRGRKGQMRCFRVISKK